MKIVLRRLLECIAAEGGNSDLAKNALERRRLV